MKKLIIVLMFTLFSTVAWSQDFSFDGNPNNNLIYMSQMIPDGEEQVTPKEKPKQHITSWNFSKTEIGLGILFLIMGLLSVSGQTPYRKK